MNLGVFLNKVEREFSSYCSGIFFSIFLEFMYVILNFFSLFDHLMSNSRYFIQVFVSNCSDINFNDVYFH